jgi:very-short-patch-repair endonuclease
MKNTLIYAPLQYRPSLLSEKQATIGLLFYEKNEGNIEFISGENELLKVKNLSPNAKISLFKVYIDVIQQKIKKNPPAKGLNPKEIHAYLDKNVLSLDDSSLQFGEIGAATNLNGNIQEKKAFYEKKFLGEGANVRENGQKKKAQIYYFSLTDEMRKEEKLQWFRENALKNIAFEKITPDKNGNWLHLSEENDWEDLLPICSKEVKAGKSDNAIFELYSLGVVTNRDEWVYDFEKVQLCKKVNFLIDVYNKDVEAHNGKSKEEIRNEIDYAIKWTRAVKNDLSKGKKYTFDESKIVSCLYRPFINKHLYFSRELNEMQYQTPAIFGESADKENFVLNLNVNGTDIRYFASNKLSDLHFLGDNQCLPLFRYENGERKENISDWALEQFREYYKGVIPVIPPQPPQRGGARKTAPEFENNLVENSEVEHNSVEKNLEGNHIDSTHDLGGSFSYPPDLGGSSFFYSPDLGGGSFFYSPPLGGLGGDNPTTPDTLPELIAKFQDEKRKLYSNLPHLKEIRRDLRKNSTQAEYYFWQYVRNQHLLGRKFRRKHSFGNYVVDFYCHEERMVIELDGAGHFTSTGIEYDEKRTAFLESLGLRVLRFENKDVLADIEGVLAYIVRFFTIEKQDIFHYVYAVLHNPAYRSKYELNLKREFPRIPFYTSFWNWAKWGQDLMALHIDYEMVTPFALVRKDATPSVGKVSSLTYATPKYVPKAKLKANKEEGKIEIDEITTLSGVPSEAWEYKLGNRSALEWILDQYKESKPSDATIAEYFNSYKFADYKESVIELLMRVCTVSVETVRIMSEMGE